MEHDPSDPLVVYTVIIGDGYRLPPVRSVQDAPHLCFTDQRLDPNGWELVPITPILPADPARSSRDPKVRPHRFLPQYSRSLFIDPTVDLLAPAQALWAALVPAPDQVFGCMHHSFRTSLADEFDEVDRASMEHARILRELRNMLQDRHPDLLAQPPYWGGVIARRHNHPACIDAMEAWFAHILRYARRDQLTLPLILSQMPAARRHIAALDNIRSPFHQWPIDGYTRPARYLDGYRRNPHYRKLRRLLQRTLGIPAY
ncbi:glycosyltransferase domain-containing protein [Paragemmobacter ruber]|uniref:DUF616 domain-containing protein n=1 Tax=Paragemmobacter ruber TaxID=1985673 RepID=A0ABW9Y6X2_9RHOB|nr:glycosyltransferase domain-containing protein [Rhodobacter ruber]NBE07594.1 DUF616 domain-containing protein [Rhodobacter ruber]